MIIISMGETHIYSASVFKNMDKIVMAKWINIGMIQDSNDFSVLYGVDGSGFTVSRTYYALL